MSIWGIEVSARVADTEARMSSAATTLSRRPQLGVLGAALRGLELLVFGALPIIFLGLIAFEFAVGFHTFDFHTFWHSGRDVLHGRSPYPHSLPDVADRHTFRPFVYPAPAAVAMVPLALLPLSVAVCVTGTLGAWAILGFAGLRQYPSLLGKLTDLVGPQSYSLYAFALSVGAPRTVAHAVVYAAGAAMLATVFVLARRRDGDRRAFTLALAAALVLSQVVWPHYLAFLFVPIALARPRLAWIWAAPLVLWMITGDWSYADPKLIAPVLALAGVVLADAVRLRLDARV